jgi:hypothetical protein
VRFLSAEESWAYLNPLNANLNPFCHFHVSATHKSDSSDRPKLEDTTNPTTHGDWRLYVQN